jgi:hypothetical protein
MFLAFKVSFVIGILAFFDLVTFWLFFSKFGKFFPQLSGHPVLESEVIYIYFSKFENAFLKQVNYKFNNKEIEIA